MNLLIDAEGRFKWADLGNTRQMYADISEQERNALPLKQRICNQVYVSPEFLEKGYFGGFSDIHSLGVILFHACILEMGGRVLVDVMKWQPQHVGKKVRKYQFPDRFSDVLIATIKSMVLEDYRLRPTAE